MRRISSAIVIATAVIAYACGSDNAAKKDGGTDSHHNDAAADGPNDARLDAPPDSSGQTVLLTVKNYAEWCTVSVGSRVASPADVQMVYVPPGVITLTATAGSGFELGSNMWHLTDGDPGYGSGSAGSESIGESGSQTGSGSAATSTAHATVALGSGKCVWVCCPYGGSGSNAGTGCSGLAEQCQ